MGLAPDEVVEQGPRLRASLTPKPAFCLVPPPSLHQKSVLCGFFMSLTYGLVTFESVWG